MLFFFSFFVILTFFLSSCHHLNIWLTFYVCWLGCDICKMESAGWCHGASFSPEVLTIPGPANISRSFPVCVQLSEEIGSLGLGGHLLILWWYQGFTGTLVISQRGNGKTGQLLPAVSHQKNMDKHTLICLCVRSCTIYTKMQAGTHKPVHRLQTKCNNMYSYCNTKYVSASVHEKF